MSKKKPDMLFKVILFCAILITLMVGGFWFWPRTPPTAPEQKPALRPKTDADSEKVAPDPAEPPRPVIRFEENDEAFQELMRRRKAEYGLEKGVDMIVRADESVRIGDTTLPMREILDKIRLKKGGVVESDLGEQPARKGHIEALFSRLRAAEDRFRSLENRLADPDADRDAATFQEQVREHAALSEVLETWQQYRETLKAYNKNADLLKAGEIRPELQAQSDALVQERTALKAALRNRLAALEPESEVPADDGELFGRLDRIEDRFRTLTDTAGTSPEETEMAGVRARIRERAALRGVMGDYQAYRAITEEVEKNRTLLAKDESHIRQELRERGIALRLKRDDLENTLTARLMPDKKVDLYGVYVVRPGDNVWNIHFRFLQEYFKHRDIILSSRSDEPVRPGISSGVGKILKFSENMVYIYNIREHELGADLNLIHPLSKIVVFNMGQAFELLSQVDFKNIRHIRFDGETLWIPAE
ncbi:hypothetical protein DENIS_1741 [Desulfonema ishimotonii]|uniref:Peptide chain release factor domain-containing protein n=1 Tax=Desulfonema ishimotonii TaxID=45657 RepID=A0A401FUX9_9BACT|nr:PCRF domain-containing protein [Desulfonema ishimotonii]GBC60782.1 hypothetical protein DENIS_1741 [Desulfonema ishimotonii]